MKNKKGFTLVEIIVVVALLAIIGTIAVVSINNRNKEEKEKSSFMNRLLKLSEVYIENHKSEDKFRNFFTKNSTEVRCITFEDLVNDGLLDENTVNPLANNSNILDSGTNHFLKLASFKNDPSVRIDYNSTESPDICTQDVNARIVHNPLNMEINGNTSNTGYICKPINSGDENFEFEFVRDINKCKDKRYFYKIVSSENEIHILYNSINNFGNYLYLKKEEIASPKDSYYFVLQRFLQKGILPFFEETGFYLEDENTGELIETEPSKWYVSYNDSISKLYTVDKALSEVVNKFELDPADWEEDGEIDYRYFFIDFESIAGKQNLQSLNNDYDGVGLFNAIIERGYNNCSVCKISNFYNYVDGINNIKYPSFNYTTGKARMEIEYIYKGDDLSSNNTLSIPIYLEENGDFVLTDTNANVLSKGTGEKDLVIDPNKQYYLYNTLFGLFSLNKSFYCDESFSEFLDPESKEYDANNFIKGVSGFYLNNFSVGSLISIYEKDDSQKKIIASIYTGDYERTKNKLFVRFSTSECELVEIDEDEDVLKSCDEFAALEDEDAFNTLYNNTYCLPTASLLEVGDFEDGPLWPGDIGIGSQCHIPLDGFEIEVDYSTFLLVDLSNDSSYYTWASRYDQNFCKRYPCHVKGYSYISKFSCRGESDNKLHSFYNPNSSNLYNVNDFGLEEILKYSGRYTYLLVDEYGSDCDIDCIITRAYGIFNDVANLIFNNNIDSYSEFIDRYPEYESFLSEAISDYGDFVLSNDQGYVEDGSYIESGTTYGGREWFLEFINPDCTNCEDPDWDPDWDPYGDDDFDQDWDPEEPDWDPEWE